MFCRQITHLILDGDFLIYFFPREALKWGKKPSPPKTFLLDYKAHSIAVKLALHSPIESTNCHSGEAAERQRCSPVLLTCSRRELQKACMSQLIIRCHRGSWAVGITLCQEEQPDKLNSWCHVLHGVIHLDMPIVRRPHSQAF